MLRAFATHLLVPRSIERAYRRLQGSLLAKLWVCLAVAVASQLTLWLLIAWRGERELERSTARIHASHETAVLASRSLALLLAQEEVTKDILLDVDNLVEAGRKSEARDANHAVLDRLVTVAPSEAMRARIERLREIESERMRPVDAGVLDLAAAQQPWRARKLYLDSYLPAREEYEAEVRALIGDAEREYVDSYAAMQTKRQHGFLVSLALLTGSMLATGTLLAFALRRSARRLSRIVEALEAVALGDLTPELPLESRDELGRLAAATNVAITSLRDSVIAIQKSVDVVVSASGLLTQSAGEVANAANDASRRLQEVAKSSLDVDASVQAAATGIEVIDSGVRTIAQRTSQAASIASTARDLAGRANAAMQQLDGSSRAIQRVVTMISAIARQTQLLALNAAIEAARAGSHGRGFAVVANEVKELAAQTAGATQDIGHRIAAIQDDSGNAVGSIREILGVIEQMHELQLEIAAAGTEQHRASVAIAQSMAEAARSSSEIAAAIEDLAAGSIQSSASVRESLRCGEELASLAHALRERVARFRLV